MVADTVAKLLYELDRPDSDDSWWDAGPGMTVIVDEAGMLNTSDLSRLVTHAEQRQWRLALVGDPHQLQAVGRGGMFLELCDTGRTVELEHLHRFTNRWEAAASLELRRGNPSALDTYAAHGRIRAGTFAEHLDTIGDLWQQCRSEGESLSIITTRTEHVNAINDHIQQRRLDTGELDPATLAQVDDAWVMVGDVVATRRNERRLRTSVGEPVRNRERWTVTATDTVEEGDVTVTRLDGHGTITLPRDYVRQHMQLAYATTEPGAQGDTSATEPHPCHQRDDETRPVHGNDSRSTREPRPGGHQHPRPRGSTSRARSRPVLRPRRHPRHGPAPQPGSDRPRQRAAAAGPDT